MGRIVVTEFVSLDGVIEDPGGSEDFKHGGWSFEIDRGDEGDKFKLDETLEAEALLLGRVTYEGFAAAWPSQGRRVRGQVQQHAQVRRLLDPRRSRTGTTRRCCEGDVAEEVAKLKQEAGRRHRRPRQRPARAGAGRARPRRRAAADGLPGRARERQAPLRRHERQEAAAAGRLEGRSATASRSSSTSRRPLRRKGAQARTSATARAKSAPIQGTGSGDGASRARTGDLLGAIQALSQTEL